MSHLTWPNVEDVANRLSASNVAFRDSADLQGALDEVIAEIERETRRQFVADTADTTRVYDGSGSPEIEVDDMVSLTSVVSYISALDTVGTNYPFDLLDTGQNLPFNRIIVARGAAWQMYPTLFPRGRQNISVTGKFGFAATIPNDVWRAVCGEAAYRLAAEKLGPFGRIASRSIDDVRVSYQSEAMNWHTSYLTVLRLYRRPLERHLRAARRQMI